jgi:2-polyprenyl-3-methyl-5-hydroxy-6-metoxy-1,4-benzoquinol methylase/ribosomal protein S18 acetylase RimI-like enzyme
MGTVFIAGGLTVRTVDPRDREAILSVYKQCEDFLSLGPVSTASMEMVIADINHSAAAKGQFCVIENALGETIGVLDFTLRTMEHTGVLSLLMISRQHRNKGHGKAIVGALESHLRDTCKVDTIESGVQVNNPDGIRFWRKRGFQIGAVARLHEDGTTAFDMHKKLEPWSTPDVTVPVVDARWAAEMADLERYYDASADRIAGEWYANKILMSTHRDFMTLLPAKPRVLDFGCGPGYESMRLHALGAEVVGIDISSASIEIARRNNPECDFRRMDFHAPDRSIGRFDGVLASGSLIHVRPERMPGVLSSIRDLLLPNGVLAAIIRDGSGSITRQHVMDGHAVGWIAYRYTEEAFSAYCGRCHLQFMRKGMLDDALAHAGWRCYCYRAGTR